MGKEWTSDEFAEAIGFGNGGERRGRSVENWRKGRNVPHSVTPIEEALFGEDQRKFLKWRQDLRRAHHEGRRNKTKASSSLEKPISSDINNKPNQTHAHADFVDPQKQQDEPSAPKPASTLNEFSMSRFIVQQHGDFLKEILTAEVSRAVEGTDIFNRTRFKQEISDVVHDVSFVRVAGRDDIPIIHPIEMAQKFSNRLGIYDRSIRKTFDSYAPLTCVLAPAQAGASAIFTFLKSKMLYDLEISYSYAHSPEIAQRIIENDFSSPPDVCVLGSAAAATVLSKRAKTEYSPLMLMPKLSQRIVAPAGAQDGSFNGNYAAIADNPSTTNFFYEKLLRSRIIKSSSQIHHVEPDETTTLLSEGDPDLRASMWFPGYLFNLKWNNCLILYADDVTIGDHATILFARKELIEDTEFDLAITTAIRNAWIMLKMSKDLISATVDEMMCDDQYIDVLLRVTGAYSLLPFED